MRQNDMASKPVNEPGTEPELLKYLSCAQNKAHWWKKHFEIFIFLALN